MKVFRSGFTLIELMIAMAVVGILATIAYPSYTEQVKKAKRADAQAALVSLASSLELWKLNNNGVYSNDTDIPTAASIFSDHVPVSGGTKTYDLAIESITATTYSLKATSVAGDRCDPLTYTHTGEKGAKESNCW
jgi:type IV pilus assembly protein PilE